MARKVRPAVVGRGSWGGGRQTERPTQATTPADKTRMCRRGKVPGDGVHGKMGKSSRKQDHCKDRLVSFLVNNDKKKQIIEKNKRCRQTESRGVLDSGREHRDI